ncbi:tyrosine-type recombinase/integrase [Methyloglobulus sp.]|uniref:tyrosine-type recombinase/integrase n=1 Tax=Methyloglobulus sp. TaxID=2518622 RepID=UPI0039898FCA
MDILSCLRRIEERGAIETAHRVKQITGRVFHYAVATGRAIRDITQDLSGALPTAKGGHFASMTDPKQVAPLLRAIDGFNGTLIVKSAMQLAPLVLSGRVNCVMQNGRILTLMLRNGIIW